MTRSEALISVSNGGTLTYLHADETGSIISTTDASANVTNKNKYSPWGEGTPAGTTFGFTGQRFDSETGLYYCKMRYYSPKLGRFLQPDPIGYGDGLNVYSFGYNSPTNFHDSMGMAGGGNGWGNNGWWAPENQWGNNGWWAPSAQWGNQAGFGPPGWENSPDIRRLITMGAMPAILTIEALIMALFILAALAAYAQQQMKNGVQPSYQWDDLSKILPTLGEELYNPSSANQAKKDLERNPVRGIDRIDGGHKGSGKPGGPEDDEVHFTDGSALWRNGKWKHLPPNGTTPITNAIKTWLEGHGWTVTRPPNFN